VKITADTNLLVRSLVDDDPRQAKLARSELQNAEVVALAATALCELVWVLRRGYGLPPAEIAGAMRVLLSGSNVLSDEALTEAGLAHLDAGGDFADGVIALDGGWLGADEFVSFDRRAVRLVTAGGGAARLLA
jgi:predicted nucleic-acid-binding protein